MYKVLPIAKALLLTVIACSWTMPALAADEPNLHMVYFYNPSCRMCIATNRAVAAAEEKYKDQLTSERFNVADSEHGLDYMEHLFIMMDELGVPEDVSSLLTVVLGEFVEEGGETVFVPKKILLEDDDIVANIDKTIEEFLAANGKGGLSLGQSRPATFFSDTALASTPPAEPEESAKPRSILTTRTARSERSEGGGTTRAQSQFRFGTITAAALADSVNPCAFATVIILVAMMSSAKRTRREIVAVCLAFTASVYVTYYAIGLFLYKVIDEINKHGGGFLIAADLVYYLAFLLCIVFGFLSLRDAYLIFKGVAAEEMVLQLPKAFKKRINVAMAKGVRARWLVVGVFIAGVTVSFLEAACTGQVYLPTIIILSQASLVQSLLLLAWYNFLFVLPLLIVFALVLLGVTSQQLADFFKKHIAWTKLALGIVFILMGWWLRDGLHWPPGDRGAAQHSESAVELER